MESGMRAARAHEAEGRVVADRWAQRRAVFHECRLYWASHPGIWLLAEAVRRGGPVVRVPGFGMVVNDPDVSREIMHRDADFTKGGRGGLGELVTQVMGPGAIMNMDGTEHRALRERLVDVFSTPAARAMVAAALDAPLADLRARLAAGETVDLVQEVRSYSGRIACRVLGLRLPAGGEAVLIERVVGLGEQLVNYAGLASLFLRQRRLEKARRAFDELAELARAGYDDPLAPEDSVVARLRAAGLSFGEARALVGALLVVGVQTVAAAVPRIVALLADTGAAAQVRDRPDLFAPAIDEALRFTAPSPVALRVTARDATVDSRRFRAGTRVLILTYNLAKCPRYFPEPWRFDPTRRPDPRVRNLWYGTGVHFCLGFALAQEEIRAIVRAATAAPGTLRVIARTPARGAFLPAYARLLVRVEP
jgi:cytochrome P450